MRWPVVLILSVSLTSLGGCLTTGSNDESAGAEESQVAAAVIHRPEPGLSARERLRKAIGLLEVGEADQARAELGAYVQEVPNSKLAGSLIQQIETDPVELFGQASYPYTLQQGESLSIVAKRALGDAMLFHGLARYNDIPNPSALKAGQTIRVPGDSPPAQVAAAVPQAEPEPLPEEPVAEAPSEPVAEPEPVAEDAPSQAPAEETEVAAIESEGALEMESEVERLQDLMLTAQGLSDQGDFQGAAALYEESIVEFPENANLKQLAAANYANFAGQLSDAGQPDTAADALRRAAELDPGDPNLAQRLASVERQADAKLLYDEGLGLYADDKLADAYTKFSEAASLDPEHLGAREKMAEVAPAVADRWHREALGHFRRQDLEAALGLWDKVLEIDPSHTQAQIYRAQAKDLDDKLKTLQTQ